MVIIVKVAMTLSQNLLQTAFSIYCKTRQAGPELDPFLDTIRSVRTILTLLLTD